jgi:NAD(P)-dependent dehydrogenase (short-subunit alcohol dehydrogenase family)
MTMEGRFGGKVAVVTGGSRGIGRAIALRLAREGASVAIAARDEAAVGAVVRELDAFGRPALGLALDLRAADAPARMVEAARERFGAVDILVNNAGATKRGDFLALTDDDFTDGFALKFYAAVRAARAAWPLLAERRGTIVNVVGVGGRTPGAEFTVGGSVNAALLSLTKALADKGVADGVRVVAVNPGPVRTGRLEPRVRSLAENQGISTEEAVVRMAAESRIMRIGEPEDIAALVAFVASPEGRLLHGALIDIDGGLTKTI